MNITSFQSMNIYSLKQALNVATLQKAMKQDAQSMDSVIKMMEQSVNPSVGSNLDIKL